MCTPHTSLISTKCKSNIFPKDGDFFFFCDDDKILLHQKNNYKDAKWP